jgi:hypothetical protein
MRVNNAFDPVKERDRRLGKRVKGPKRRSLGYYSKNATKEKVREGIFFSAVKRAKRIKGRDEEGGF